ncbi:MAG: HAMP domain-containing protein [Polyangiaceae bacterium]|nr:HAMP domain-containing protein [Polyangiaceae bacterium]
MLRVVDSRSPMRLARKFLISVVAVAFVVMFLGVWAALSAERALHETDLARDHTLLGGALVHLLEHVPENGFATNARIVLSGTVGPDSQVTARLLFPDGITPTNESALLVKVLAENKPLIAARETGRGLYITLLPIQGRRAVLELSEPFAEQDRILTRTAVRYVIMSLALTLGFAIVTLVLGRRFIGGPMKLLVTQARAIGAGHLDEMSNLHQRDEIGDLAIELNQMSAKLRASEEQTRKESERRLAAVNQLRHADRLATVGTLASGIAHELGTPLAVVQGRATLIEEAVSDAEVIKSARVITEQVSRMSRILRQVLDFARRTTPSPQKATLLELVEKAVSLLQPISQKRGVAVEIRQKSRVSVLADANLIHQVFTNLIMNAIQATVGRAPTVFVEVAEQSLVPPVDLASESGTPGSPQKVGVVSIVDHGAGIAPELVAHVFEPFFTTKDVGEGTGLGLSVAWGIVRDHDGWIEVESRVNERTTFRVILPAAGG